MHSVRRRNKTPELFMFQNLDLTEVSLNTSRDLEAHTIIKPEYMKYIIDLCVIWT